MRYKAFCLSRTVLRIRKSKKDRQCNGQMDKQRSTKHKQKIEWRASIECVNDIYIICVENVSYKNELFTLREHVFVGEISFSHLFEHVFVGEISFSHLLSFLCCLVFFCFVCLRSVSCIQCSQWLWIIHSLLPLRVSLTFIYKHIKRDNSFITMTYRLDVSQVSPNLAVLWAPVIYFK